MRINFNVYHKNKTYINVIQQNTELPFVAFSTLDKNSRTWLARTIIPYGFCNWYKMGKFTHIDTRDIDRKEMYRDYNGFSSECLSRQIKKRKV